MMRNPKYVTGIVSGYLVVYCILLGSGAGFWRAFAVGMFFFSPVLMVWLVYVVIRYGSRTAKELEAGAEFGYSDRPTASLGVW